MRTLLAIALLLLSVLGAKAGYVFLNWKDGSNIVSTLPSYTFAIISSRSLVANFAVGFTITATSSFAPGGTVSGAGGYATGSNGTLVATPAAGYQFTNWTENGTAVSSGSSYSFTAAANRTLVANFLPIVGVGSAAPDSLLIAWPSSATGWTLQESPDLSLGSWAASARTVTVNSNQNQVIISPPTGNRFFRLTHP